MATLPIPDYIKNRVVPTIVFCEENSKSAKYRYRAMQIVIVVGGATIPVVNVIQADTIRIVSALLGAIVAAMTGLNQMYRYHEEWLLFRSTGTLLMSEKYLYETDAGDYAKKATQKEKDNFFVERIEAMIRDQETKYNSTHSSQQLNEIKAQLGFVPAVPKPKSRWWG